MPIAEPQSLAECYGDTLRRFGKSYGPCQPKAENSLCDVNIIALGNPPHPPVPQSSTRQFTRDLLIHTECTWVKGDSRIHHTTLTIRAPHIETDTGAPAMVGQPITTTVGLNRGVPIHDAITIAAEVRGTLSLGRNIVLCGVYRRD